MERGERGGGGEEGEGREGEGNEGEGQGSEEQQDGVNRKWVTHLTCVCSLELNTPTHS